MNPSTLGRNEIDVFSQIGQLDLWMNPRDHAADIEEFGSAAEERLLVGIEAETFVTEESTDVKKISGAASKIENAEGRSSIEPTILGVCHVNADPVSCVFIRVDPSCIGPIRIRLTQSG